MNLDETTRLCKLISAACPAQRWEDETPAIWAGLLDDVRLADAIEAVKRLGRRARFIAPADIRAEVRAIRTARLERFTPVPQCDPDDSARWAREQRALIRQVADGTYAGQVEIEGTERPEITRRIGGMFRSPGGDAA